MLEDQKILFTNPCLLFIEIFYIQKVLSYNRKAH